ncbi:MAG: RluA family pseudouridine synthase [Candidatus Levybacteria bacterium]|nr:RluA family pseudouridine synthase [Candidatus Levybacteria bacterium]
MENSTIQIIYEDESVLVINKPAGITVNRSETAKEDTVHDWAEEYLKIRSPVPYGTGRSTEHPPRGENFECLNRGGIVHRLDKETSGVLLLAKTPEVFVELQRQFKERLVEKTYIALVHGMVKPSIGEIRAPVGRLPWNRKQFGIVPGGRESVTKYKVISNFKFPHSAEASPNRPTRRGKQISNDQYEELTLVELHPETGRTHQIRVHLKYIGHPIVSDFLYAGRKTARDDRKHLSRVFLHAQSLSFLHPTTGERKTVSAHFPEELSAFLNSLEKVE